MIDSILQIILKNVVRFENNSSFKIGSQMFTYASLGEAISSIRCEIHNMVEPIVGLAIHDDLLTYASILALWMEGKAYVPLHPNQPIERNLEIIKQVGINSVLDSQEGSVYDGKVGQVIRSSLLQYEGEYLDDIAYISDDKLAYILFTSGSTGVPKGVQITRGNVAAFMDSFWKSGIYLDEYDRCLQVFDLTFDVSIQSFLAPLIRGACVYTVPYGQVKYLYAASLIQEQHITFGAMAPSMLTYLRPYFDEFDASSMRTTILTAEACPVELIEEWQKCAKNTEVYDFYGPTETTIYSTSYHISRDRDIISTNGVVSIGRPLANVKAVIIDESGDIVEGDIKGELCIAGPQVTSGYWSNEEKNLSSFFTLKVDGKEQRFYHTGDLCYWDVSGNIMYCGRIDQQVKMQGFRVELGEIEYHARGSYGNDRRVVAVAFDNDKSLVEIALFVESESDDPTELLSYLRSKMPQYMIPSRIIFEESLPLNKSEKIDRNALKIKLQSI